MSFQAYIDNITKITGQTPDQIREQALAQNIISEDMKATAFVNWLGSEYGLGKGHAMSMWKYFLEHDWIITKHSKI